MANQTTPAIQVKDSNVGIGTSSPAFKLDVSGTFHSGGDATFNGTNTYINSSYIYVGNNTADLVSISGNTMYFPGNGNVLIGTTTDGGYKLDVNGTGRIQGNLYTTARQYVQVSGNTLVAYKIPYNGLSNVAGTTVSDSQASNGTAMVRYSTEGNNTFFYGPYTTLEPGNYVAKFRIKVASNASASYIGYIDVSGTNVNGQDISLCPNMFPTGGDYYYIDVPFTCNGSASNIEFRWIDWRTGITDTYLDHVLVTSQAQANNVYVQDGGSYTIYEAQLPRLKIQNGSGNVGIGTTAPTYKLHVSGGPLGVNIGTATNNQSAVQFVDSARGLTYMPTVAGGAYNWASVLNGSALFNTINSDWWVGNHDGSALRFVQNSSLVFYTNSGARGAWTGTGLGIGTTSPATRIDARDNPTSTNGVIQATPTYSGGSYFTAFRAVPSDTGDQGNYTGLFMGSISSDNALITSGSVYNSAGQYLPGGTTSTGIGMGGGTFTVFGNTGLTAGTQFAPTARMQVIGSTGNVLIGTTTDAGYRVNLSGDINVSGAVRLAGGGATVTFISESWGINLNGSATQPTQVRGSSFSVGYVLGAGTNYGTGNMFVSGIVGIGELNPTQLLHLTGTNAANNGITIQNTNASGNSQVRFLNASGVERAAITYINAADAIYMYTSAGGNLLNLVGGNVLIGTTTDNGAKLNVNGTSYINGAASFGSTIGVNGNVTLTQDTNDLIFQQTNSSSHGIVWKNTSYTKDSASIRPTGNGAWATQGIGFYTGNAGDSTTAPSLRFNIQAGGDSIFYNNVGIGTTGPSGSLHISGVSNYNTGVLIDGNTINGVGLGLRNTNGHDWYLISTGSNNGGGANNLGFYDANAGTYHVYFGGNGNVGIGSTSPAAKLNVASTGANAYSGTITKGTNMKGIINALSNNADDMVGIYFGTGTTSEGTHWSGITGSRSNSAVDWSTQLNFYTHDENLSNITDATQKMVIKGSGNVGIGTTAPSEKLDITDGKLRFTNTSSGRNSTIGMDDNFNFYVKNTPAGNLYIGNGTTTYVTGSFNAGGGTVQIPSGGNVIIGSTTDAGYKLDVHGEILGRDDIRILNTYALILNGTDANWRIGRNTISDSGWLTSNTMQMVVFGSSSGQGFQVVNHNGTALFEIDGVAGASRFTNALGVGVNPSGTAGRIDASNDIVAYSTSDQRLKENITPIVNALDKVKALTGVEFDWKEETKDVHGYEGHDVGVIAQEVQSVLPEAVRTNDSGYLSVRYEKMIALLVEANKELASRIEELEKKLK